MLAAVLSVLCGPIHRAWAQEKAEGPDDTQEDAFTWPEEGRKVGAADYALSGLALSALALRLAPGRSNAWEATGQADRAVRKALRGGNVTTRERAGHVSDVLLTSTMLFPMVVDSFFLAGVYHRSWETSLQMAMLSAEALILNASVTAVAKVVATRMRPDAMYCNSPQGAQDPACEGDLGSELRSFFSGHSSSVAAAAGASCMFHARLPLYEKSVGGRLSCGLIATAAATTGALRIVADRHHVSDVLTGLAVGFAIGAAVPALHLPRPERRRAELSLMPGAGGVSLLGRF